MCDITIKVSDIKTNMRCGTVFIKQVRNDAMTITVKKMHKLI